MKKNILAILIVSALTLCGCQLGPSRDVEDDSNLPEEVVNMTDENEEVEVEEKMEVELVEEEKVEQAPIVAYRVPIVKEPEQEGITWFDTYMINSALHTYHDLQYDVPLYLDVNQDSDGHARGMVAFNEGGGKATFVAKKENGGWTVSYDGVGPFPCSEVKGDGYPYGMVSDCYPSAAIK